MCILDYYISIGRCREKLFPIASQDYKHPQYVGMVKRYKSNYGHLPSYFITKLIRCNKCKKWLTPINMYHIERSCYWVGNDLHTYYVKHTDRNNQCLFCFTDWRIKELVYSRLYGSTKLKRSDIPKDLFDAEVLLTKTKFLLNPIKYKEYKIKIYDYIGNQFGGDSTSTQRELTRPINREKKTANSKRGKQHAGQNAIRC